MTDQDFRHRAVGNYAKLDLIKQVDPRINI